MSKALLTLPSSLCRWMLSEKWKQGPLPVRNWTIDTFWHNRHPRCFFDSTMAQGLLHRVTNAVSVGDSDVVGARNWTLSLIWALVQSNGGWFLKGQNQGWGPRCLWQIVTQQMLWTPPFSVFQNPQLLVNGNIIYSPGFLPEGIAFPFRLCPNWFSGSSPVWLCLLSHKICKHVPK